MGSQHGVIDTFGKKLLPRNSIHSLMSESQIIATINATKSLQIFWKIEDRVKPMLKKMLPKPTYSIIKKLIAGNIKNF